MFSVQSSHCYLHLNFCWTKVLIYFVLDYICIHELVIFQVQSVTMEEDVTLLLLLSSSRQDKCLPPRTLSPPWPMVSTTSEIPNCSKEWHFLWRRDKLLEFMDCCLQGSRALKNKQRTVWGTWGDSRTPWTSTCTWWTCWTGMRSCSTSCCQRTSWSWCQSSTLQL